MIEMLVFVLSVHTTRGAICCDEIGKVKLHVFGGTHLKNRQRQTDNTPDNFMSLVVGVCC